VLDGQKKAIRSHRDLLVYQRAFATAARIREVSRTFPKEEMYSLTDQIRRSSRSVTANIAEAWRKRRYEAAFVSKLNDAEGEAAETQVWIEHAVDGGYVDRREARELYRACDEVLRMLVAMIHAADRWCSISRQSR
jgi:four helix bundle protein